MFSLFLQGYHPPKSYPYIVQDCEMLKYNRIPLDVLNKCPVWKTDTWFVFECGGGGNCLFHAIATALQVSQQEQIRKLCSYAVEKWNFDYILNYYKHEETRGTWDRSNVHTVEDLRQIICTSGPTYEGDDMSLRLLSSILPVGFVIVPFSQTEPIHQQIFMNETTVQFLVLFHVGNHWQLIANRINDENWQVLFDPLSPPPPFPQITPHIPKMLQWAPHVGQDDQSIFQRKDAWFRVLSGEELK